MLCRSDSTSSTVTAPARTGFAWLPVPLASASLSLSSLLRTTSDRCRVQSQLERPASSLVDVKTKTAKLLAKQLAYFGVIRKSEGVTANLSDCIGWTAILLVDM